MQHDRLTDFEERVIGAVKPLSAFNAQLIEELDEQNGAFKFWHGGSDWKTYALLADYLIQSVRGTTTALNSAGLSVIEHRQAIYSINNKSRTAYNDLRAGKKSWDEYVYGIYRSAEARKRSLRAESHAEHAFLHMGQALDRFSSALVIVGGFGVKDVLTSDWKTIETIWATISSDCEPQLVESLNTRGREIQKQLLAL